MKTFTVSINDNLDQALNELKEDMGKPSRAEVFRLAITLLKMAKEANDQGLRITISDKANQVLKEILIPWTPARASQQRSAAALPARKEEDLALSKS